MRPPAFRVDLEDGHELVRIVIWQRAQQHAVYNTENCRGRADGQCQREDHDRGDAGISAQLSQTVAAIGENGVEPVAHAFFANLFFHLLETAKFHPRGALRFFEREAGTNIFVCQYFELRANLLVKISLDTAREEDISQETSSFHKERHAGDLYDASKACAMAQEIRPHRLVSASSCFRPGLVKR